MPLYRVVHAFHGNAGTSKDDYVNNFHIWHPTQVLDSSTNVAFSTGVATMIKYFYDGAGGTSGLTIREYMSKRVEGLRTVKIYTAAVPFSGAPLYSETTTYGGSMPDVQSLPEEVSLCLSYIGNATGVSPARKRGRIYLGPFSIAAMNDIFDTDQPVRPADGLITAILSQASGLAAALDSGGYEWRVYSPTNNNSYAIEQFSVDDAFDTVRNRGTAPSARVTASFP